MIKLMVLVSLFFCMKAFAGYKCNLQLSDNDGSSIVISEREIIASEKDMLSKNIDNLFTEFMMGDNITSLSAKTFISGWSGEEEISISIFRRVEKDENVQLEEISDKVSLRGDGQDTLWFENYKLDLSCSLI